MKNNLNLANDYVRTQTHHQIVCRTCTQRKHLALRTAYTEEVSETQKKALMKADRGTSWINVGGNQQLQVPQRRRASGNTTNK